MFQQFGHRIIKVNILRVSVKTSMSVHGWWWRAIALSSFIWYNGNSKCNPIGEYTPFNSHKLNFHNFTFWTWIFSFFSSFLPFAVAVMTFFLETALSLSHRTQVHLSSECKLLSIFVGIFVLHRHKPARFFETSRETTRFGWNLFTQKHPQTSLISQHKLINNLIKKGKYY